jgi:hypothetical protein
MNIKIVKQEIVAFLSSEEGTITLFIDSDGIARMDRKNGGRCWFSGRLTPAAPGTARLHWSCGEAEKFACPCVWANQSSFLGIEFPDQSIDWQKRAYELHEGARVKGAEKYKTFETLRMGESNES